MKCQYQSRNRDKGQFSCSLGLYGGHPWLGNCKLCIERGQNNEEYAKELFSKAERSHPSGVARISGCCDSARNYID
jgi:hypothetical protein